MRLKLIIASLALAAVALTGCIVSGTFVFTDSFSLSVVSGYSHEYVDVTDDEDWEDAKDDIDRIESVGFEIWFTNPGSELTFDAYVSDPPEGAVLGTIGAVTTSGTLVIDDFTVPSGSSTMSYANSFNFIQNVEKLRELAKGGAFHVYGISSGSATFTIDSAKVIITLNASATP